MTPTRVMRRVDGRVDDVEHRLGEDAEDDDQHDQRSDRELLPAAQVGASFATAAAVGPVIVRWYMISMYSAARTMLQVAMIAATAYR